MYGRQFGLFGDACFDGSVIELNVLYGAIALYVCCPVDGHRYIQGVTRRAT